MFHWKDKMHLHRMRAAVIPRATGPVVAAVRALAGADAGSQKADCVNGQTDRRTAAGGGSDQRNHHMLLQPTFEQATSSCPPRHMITHAMKR